MLHPATKRQDAAFIRFRCPHRKEERTPVTLSQIQHLPFGPGHHLKLQRAPLHDVGMFQHITIQFMSVQLHGFHVGRTGSAFTLHHDGELLSTGQHDFRMDNAALPGVIMGQAVPFIRQFGSASVGGCGNSGTALAALDDTDGDMTEIYGEHLLSVRG